MEILTKMEQLKPYFDGVTTGVWFNPENNLWEAQARPFFDPLYEPSDVKYNVTRFFSQEKTLEAAIDSLVNQISAFKEKYGEPEPIVYGVDRKNRVNLIV